MSMCAVSGNVGGDDYVLVPYVDSMNHVTSIKTDLSFSPITGDFSISVDRCKTACLSIYLCCFSKD